MQQLSLRTHKFATALTSKVRSTATFMNSTAAFQPSKVPFPQRSLNTTTITMSTARTAVDETGKKGEFVRTASIYRSTIEKGGQYEPEGMY